MCKVELSSLMISVPPTGAHTTKDEGASMAWIVQHLQDTSVARQSPDEFTFVRAALQARRELQTLLMNVAGGLHGAGRVRSNVSNSIRIAL